MYQAYFDENKYSLESPYFYIGGIILKDDNIVQCEQILSQIQYNFFGSSILNHATEMHGKEIFHGKSNFRQHNIKNRLELLDQLASFLVDHHIPIRIICIDVNSHRAKYHYPEPEYRLGLMLFLERYCDFLDSHDDIGLVFGDYERDEIARAILDFSQFKISGKTPMYLGRPLGRLVDTIYFTHSHHSRFLQVADIVIYLANRFERINEKPEKWHELQGWNIWQRIKEKTDVQIQRWP